MARQTVTDEVKAAALADLANGDQPAIVAERYKLNAPTVRKWKERLELSNVTPVVTENVTPVVTLVRRPSIEDQQKRILDLMYQNLAAKLTASQRLAEHVTDQNWLYRQSAEGVAALGEYLDATAAHTLALLAGRNDGDA